MDRKLYRSRNQRMVAGVCGGIAEYFDIDPTIVRLIAVLLTVVGNGAPVIAYIVIWVAVPEAPLEGSASSTSAATSVVVTPAATTEPVVEPAVAPAPPVEPPPAPVEEPAPAPAAAPAAAPMAAPVTTIIETSSGRGTIFFGLVLVLIGLAFVAEVFIPGLNIWQFWPLILVLLGLRMIITGKGD